MLLILSIFNMKRLTMDKDLKANMLKTQGNVEKIDEKMNKERKTLEQLVERMMIKGAGTNVGKAKST